MDSFLIAVSKRLGLPGFGDNAIPDHEGNLHPLNKSEDFYLRAAANIAFQGKQLPQATASDIEHGGIASLLPKLDSTLKPQERGSVAYMYARGGRFEDYDQSYVGKHHRYAWRAPLCIYNEQVGTAIDSYTGQRLVGTPQFQEAKFYDGTPMRKIYSKEDWPLLAFSFKSNIMNSYSAGLERLRMIKPYNPVLVNRIDAQRAGIEHGDTIEIESPGGKVIGLALVSEGVKPGALGIEHGYGHRELGASEHDVDGVKQPVIKWIGAGINLNDLGFADPTREVMATWLESVSGASVRQGLPVRISRLDS